MTVITSAELIVDPHAIWSTQVAALFAQMRGADDDTVDRLTAAADVIERRIAETPAQTLAGVIEQLRCALRFGTLIDDSVEATAVTSALAMIERFASQP